MSDGEVVARVLRQHDGVMAVVVEKSRQSFAKLCGEEMDYEGEGGQHRGMEMCSLGSAAATS